MRPEKEIKLSGAWNNLKVDNRTQLLIVLGLIGLGVVFRLVPHPPNFAPITALALFGGAMLPKRIGVWVPLTAVVISDLFIGLHSLVWATWGAFFVIAYFASHRLNGRINSTNLLASIIGSSVFFYLLTNAAVWLDGKLYPRTIAGLGESYVAAIPFFRNTLLGDLFFSGVLFGSYYLAMKLSQRYNSRLAHENLN